jgi:hypothetical protein
MLTAAIDEQTHLLRDTIAFVHWARTTAASGDPRPHRARRRRVRARLRRLAHAVAGKFPYLWHRALSWNDKIVVPTETGLSVITVGDKLDEQHHEFASPATQKTRPPSRR